ncbi:MAG: NAD(P)/FAD-dependent oxidoreductase [Gammaproteobacteria bacterium]|nr:NAD(P)/FAD-dependent oxidoreductase [Gammaproteobacteria bacterium]
MNGTSHHQIVIIGGGTGGIAVAARLQRALASADIAIIEPSECHYYQPGWTLVGGGIIDKEFTLRSTAELIPHGVQWIRDAVTDIRPDSNQIVTQSGATINYDYLITAAGIQINWGAVKGLPETLGKNGVCSIYDYRCSETTWQMINGFKGGTALFTQPKPPFKCPGAAQKIMYLADDAFRRNRVRDSSQVLFRSAAPGIFPVKKYADTLNQVIARKGLQVKFQHHLIEVRADSCEAIIENIADGAQEIINYDLLHVTPPMGAPDFLKRSPLADAAGWVDVHKHTLQHVRYPNVFGLGDCTNTPNSKTAAAIRRQMPVLVKNLLAVMRNGTATEHYNGYASCPLITGYGKLVLAEFDYDMKPMETFPFDQGKERLSMYWLKRYILPPFYWYGLLKGHTLGGE